MRTAFKIIPVILDFIVAVISWIMAWKSFFSNRFLPFHEKAAGKTLEQLDEGVRDVILALMKITGFGFLTVGIMLVVFPVMNFFKPQIMTGIGIPLICGIYCFGLFLVNRQLYLKSGAETPWKGSLIAAAILFIGIIMTIL